jgi:hypothetical protein
VEGEGKKCGIFRVHVVWGLDFNLPPWYIYIYIRREREMTKEKECEDGENKGEEL